MSRSKLSDTIWFIVIIAAVVITAIHLYRERSHNQFIDRVLTGPVRANAASGVFHVPTCPQYDDVGDRNLRLFATALEAREAGFRPSMNCLHAVKVREYNEAGNFPDIDPSYDDPR